MAPFGNSPDKTGETIPCLSQKPLPRYQNGYHLSAMRDKLYVKGCGDFGQRFNK